MRSSNLRRKFNDLLKLIFGTGNDVEAYYDGTDMNLKTGLVNPSDLVLDCGTAKTLELTQAVWDDLRTPANAVKLDSTNPPSSASYRDGSVLSFSKIQNQKIYFNVQVPHRYELGSDIEFHIHYVLPTGGSGAGAENVKWDFTYSWANIGDAFPASTPATATIDVQNLSADTHYLGEIEDSMDGSGIDGVSSMLICSLERDTSVADNYDDVVYLLEVDFHYKSNTMGSRLEVAK